MASSVWTATVWGQGKAAILAATNRKIQPGEEECHICKDDVPASVTLKPCSHMICFGCVENLRAKNIFRADKGVKCPFCRQYVTQYEPCNSADPEQVRLLNEANRAAAFATAGRGPNGAVGSGAAGGSGAASAAPADESWMCLTCRCLNLSHREECSSCARPNPRPKPVTNRSKDVLKCSDDEVIGFILERHQPNIQRCFSEAGIGCSLGRIVTDAETPQRILNAFKQRGEERMLRVIKLLGDPAVFLECATHFLGNYGLQSLVEATLKIRQAIELADAQGQSVLASFRSANDGRDPHAVLLYAALPNAVELATHERGNYLIQKLADHAGPQELVDLCGAVFPQGPELAKDNKGVYVMNKLLTTLMTVCSEGIHRFDACELADTLCCHFMEAPEKLKFCLHNSLASKVLAAAVTLGLPQYGALQLGSRVSSHAARLAASKHGVSCVMSLLEMESTDTVCNELVRDLLCTVAMKLQGGLVGLLLRRTCDERGPLMVRTLLRRLASEQEIGWLDAICQELVNYGDVISDNAEALQVLKESFCFNVLDDDTVLEHLLQLRQVVTSEDVMRSIEEDVCGRRDSNLAPPPPRYFMPSVIQPDLKYMMMRGYSLPEAPAPPPRVAGAAASYGDVPAATGFMAGRGGGRGAVRGGRGGFAGGRGPRPHGAVANPAFDESFFAEGLYDPTAPVQAGTGTSGADAWATTSDPWAVASVGEDWLDTNGAGAHAYAAQQPAEGAQQQPQAVQAPSVASFGAPTAGQKAGQILLQSLQRQPSMNSQPAGPAVNGHFPGAQPAAGPQTRPLVPPNPALQPAAAPRPVAHPLLPPALAANPTLAAARAVAQAAMHAQQTQSAQPQQQPPQQRPQQHQHPQYAQQQTQYAQQQTQYAQQQTQGSAQNAPASSSLSQPPQQVRPSEQHQHQLPYPQIAGAAPVVYMSQGGTNGGYGQGGGGGMAVSYAPTGPSRPQAAMPFPLALFNPALAVLNNTAGIAAFAPRGPHAMMQRPVAVPVSQTPVAVPMPGPPQPSASLTAAASAAQPSGHSTANVAAAAAAAAAAARRPATVVPVAVPRPMPPPVAAQPPPPAPPAAVGAWQCQICTYDHKGPESQFLACAVCGCERGVQQLPS